MRTERLGSADNAAKNAKLLSRLGETGFRAVKSAYALLRHPKEKSAELGRLAALERAVPAGSLPFDGKDWHRRFTRLLLTTNNARAMTLAESFLSDPLVPARFACGAAVTGFDAVQAEIGTHAKNVPIVLFAVKNDLVRVKKLLPYYRSIGAERFAAIDNGSTDGTLEFLLGEPDTDVFTTRAAFGSVQKAGWLDRLASFYGTDRWYLWLDADEFFDYPGRETHPLGELTRALEAKGEHKLRSFMLDMYPEGELLDPARKNEDFLTDCVYFDPDSDDYTFLPETSMLSGGMRRRVFGLENGTLSKITLLHFGGDRLLTGAHTVYPQSEDYGGAFSGVLRHYKFLPGDLEKYRRIADAGTYANGSAEYKCYLAAFRSDPHLSAKTELSRRYGTSEDLAAFPFIRKLFTD